MSHSLANFGYVPKLHDVFSVHNFYGMQRLNVWNIGISCSKTEPCSSLSSKCNFNRTIKFPFKTNWNIIYRILNSRPSGNICFKFQYFGRWTVWYKSTFTIRSVWAGRRHVCSSHYRAVRAEANPNKPNTELNQVHSQEIDCSSIYKLPPFGSWALCSLCSPTGTPWASPPPGRLHPPDGCTPGRFAGSHRTRRPTDDDTGFPAHPALHSAVVRTSRIWRETILRRNAAFVAASVTRKNDTHKNRSE